VPVAVKVTLNISFVHVLVLGLGLFDRVTPLGVEVKSMSCMLEVSLLTNTTVVPGATVRVDGWKFSDVFPPTPAGITMLTVGPEVLAVELEVVLLVVLDVGDDVVVVEVVDEVVVLLALLGVKMKYAAAAISITTMTAAATAPAPIAFLFCTNFIPSDSPIVVVFEVLLSVCGRRVQKYVDCERR
jgi:hypothetical protein